MRLPTPNYHGSTRERIGRGKKQREVVGWHLKAYELRYGKPALPCVVSITRLSARVVGTDMAISSTKHVRDAIAVWLLGGKPGERDDDPAIEWEYPPPERAKQTGVRIEIRSK